MSLTGKRSRPFRIFLADLVYDTIKTTVCMPLNIGYIASFLNKIFSNDIEIKVFKFPKKLEKALKEDPPDMLGLSYYSWNARLDLVFLDLAKRLNPKMVTVMGGPNIRREPEDIHSFLKEHNNLDYYITDEGEHSLGRLVGEILEGKNKAHPEGCAAVIDGRFYYEREVWNKKDKQIGLPSPYLFGYLDEFLKDPNIIPMIETNRGCPFGCIYCTFGNKALSKLRLFPLEQVFEDIDYIIKNCVGQKKWMVVDANFGIVERDLEVAKKLRKTRDENAFPYEILIWDSKNTSQRNIEIYKIIGSQNRPLIAIQTADPVVSVASGRGKISFEDIKKQVDYFNEMGLETKTDIILGLPCESAKSHFYTLKTAFDMGFDWFVPKELRLLAGTIYEKNEEREKYKLKTMFRPIYGAYGIYDNKLVFELEESVRYTKDMTQEEMNKFKVHHFLITFAWSGGLFKPLLRLGQYQGINPIIIIDELSRTNHPLLKGLFDSIRTGINDEYFETADAMIAFYEKRENFDKMVNGFFKLIYYYSAQVYLDKKLLEALEKEIINLLERELRSRGEYNKEVLDDIVKINKKIICRDFLKNEFSIKEKHLGESVAILMKDKRFSGSQYVDVEIYRPKEVVSFCRYELVKDGKEDLSMHNITRFLERKGLDTMTNKIRCTL